MAGTAERDRQRRSWLTYGALLLAGGAVIAFAATAPDGSGGDPVQIVPGGAPTTAPTVATAEVTPATAAPSEADYRAALAMWRVPRAKDSCVSCHGPDFIDLARIGTSDSDLIRRAVLDGASSEEAQALLRGVQYLRARYAMPAENPRTFRPFQPGGALLPGANSVERDAAFGEELAKVLPTLTGSTRVATLADAKRARDELLNLDWDKFRIGIPFPRWSADIAHGPQEGTMNDWVSDLPRVPRPAYAAQWQALQDAYLNEPSETNFWRLYFAADDMTEGFAGVTPADPADTRKVHDFSLIKYRSTLIGQHLLRMEALRRQGFTRGQIAFSYLATDPGFAVPFKAEGVTLHNGYRLEEFLPNPMWEVGDFQRRELEPSDLTLGQPGNRGTSDRFRDQLRLLGYPQFVLDSIDPNQTIEQADDELRTAWFMIGFRFDPSLLRVSPSNSTKVGEYLLGQLWKQDMFIHRAFLQFTRMVAASYNPQAMVKASPPFKLQFNYFTGYNRAVPNRWNTDASAKPSAAAKARQLELYKRITANMFRMSLLLHEEALSTGQIAPYGNATNDGEYDRINEFFNYAGQPGRAADDALIRRVAARAGKALTF